MDGNMSLSMEQLLALSKELSSRDVRLKEMELEHRMEVERMQERLAQQEELNGLQARQIEELHAEVRRLRGQMERQANDFSREYMITQFYLSFFILSQKKVSSFIEMVGDMTSRTFLSSMINWCLVDDAPPEVRSKVNEMLKLPYKDRGDVVKVSVCGDLNVENGNLLAKEIKSDRTEVQGDSYDIHDNPDAKFNFNK